MIKNNNMKKFSLAIFIFVLAFFGNFINFTKIEASGLITLTAKDITQTSVTLVAEGALDQSSYSFYIYDKAVYSARATTPLIGVVDAVASKSISLGSTSYSISVPFVGLQAGHSYVGLLDYNLGMNEASPTVEIQTLTDFTQGLEQLSVDSVTSTSVSLSAVGLSDDANMYYVYLVNDTNKTPNTVYKGDPKPIVEINNGTAKISFTGLVKYNNYVAYIVKNYEDQTFLGRVYFVATTPTTATSTGTINTTTTSTATTGGIVPTCNTGEINTATGQYKNPCDFSYFMKLINSLIKFLLFDIATPFIALIIMYTAYLFLTAGGSAGQTEKAKHILFNVVIGYIVALAAWLIVNTIVTSILPKNTDINTFLDKSSSTK